MYFCYKDKQNVLEDRPSGNFEEIYAMIYHGLGLILEFRGPLPAKFRAYSRLYGFRYVSGIQARRAVRYLCLIKRLYARLQRLLVRSTEKLHLYLLDKYFRCLRINRLRINGKFTTIFGSILSTIL